MYMYYNLLCVYMYIHVYHIYLNITYKWISQVDDGLHLVKMCKYVHVHVYQRFNSHSKSISSCLQIILQSIHSPCPLVRT